MNLLCQIDRIGQRSPFIHIWNILPGNLLFLVQVAHLIYWFVESTKLIKRTKHYSATVWSWSDGVCVRSDLVPEDNWSEGSLLYCLCEMHAEQQLGSRRPQWSSRCPPTPTNTYSLTHTHTHTHTHSPSCEDWADITPPFTQWLIRRIFYFPLLISFFFLLFFLFSPQG